MLWITEKYVNRNKSETYNVVNWYETKFEDNQLRDLMRSCSKAFGRPRSVWRDKPGGGKDRMQVGWVFEKSVEYNDISEATPVKDRIYLREVWVEVSIGNPQREPAFNVVSPWVKPA